MTFFDTHHSLPYNIAICKTVFLINKHNKYNLFKGKNYLKLFNKVLIEYSALCIDRSFLKKTGITLFYTIWFLELSL